MEGYGDSWLEGQFVVNIFEVRNGTVRVGDITTLQNVEEIRVYGELYSWNARDFVQI